MPSPVDFSQLRVFAFCREFRNTTSLDLIGVHDHRFSSTFPTRFEEELVLAVIFEGAPGVALHMQIQVRLDGDAPEAVAATDAAAGPDGVFISGIPFDSFVFQKPGQYRFALYVAGTLVGATSLTVEQAPKVPLAPGSSGN